MSSTSRTCASAFPSTAWSIFPANRATCREFRSYRPIRFEMVTASSIFTRVYTGRHISFNGAMDDLTRWSPSLTFRLPPSSLITKALACGFRHFNFGRDKIVVACEKLASPPPWSGLVPFYDCSFRPRGAVHGRLRPLWLGPPRPTLLPAIKRRQLRALVGKTTGPPYFDCVGAI